MTKNQMTNAFAIANQHVKVIADLAEKNGLPVSMVQEAIITARNEAAESLKVNPEDIIFGDNNQFALRAMSKPGVPDVKVTPYVSALKVSEYKDKQGNMIEKVSGGNVSFKVTCGILGIYIPADPAKFATHLAAYKAMVTTLEAFGPNELAGMLQWASQNPAEPSESRVKFRESGQLFAYPSEDKATVNAPEETVNA